MDERIARAVTGALHEQDRSGYELWHWLGPVHGSMEELTEPTLYPILYRLEAERMIGGTWREADRARRRYRLSSRGVDRVARRGWPAIACRTTIDPILTAPTAEKPTDAAAAAEPPATIPDGAQGSPRTIDEYLDRMQSGLRLSEAEQIGVRDEIRHHLEDSSNALVERGLVPAAATIEAIARLGSPEVLAEAINSAKLTRVRLFKGLRSASMAAVFGATMGVLAGGTTIAFTPIVARFLTFLALQVGIHIYAPENGAWWSQQLCLTACVAAFMAARRSLPFVAQHTGRAETLVRPIWALAGAIPLAIFAILLPESLDTMVVVALLGIPICFVAGTWLSQGHEDDLVSRKGIAGAVVLLAALLLAPGFRMWTFDPSAGPSAAPPSAASASAHMSWESDGAAADTWIVTVPDLDIATWHDARLEFWPAIRQGFAIVPEQSATGPTSTAALGTTVDLTALPGSNQDWWVTLTAVGPDGVRRTLAAEIHFGASGSGQQNILGQILGHG